MIVYVFAVQIDHRASQVIIMLHTLYFILWPLAVFKYLVSKFPQVAEKNGNFFNCSVIAIYLGVVFAIPLVNLTISIANRELFQLSSPFAMIVGFVGVGFTISYGYIFLRSIWLSTKVLLFLEGHEKVNYWKFFITLMLFVYWPIGVVFLQKRIVELKFRQMQHIGT